jgi:hypothetical protein
MASRQMRNLVVIVLIMLNFLALGGIFQVWWGQGGSSGLPHSPKAIEIPVAPILRNQQGLDAFRVVSSKNLFSQDRTGPDQETAAPQKQGDLEGKLLLGTIIIGNQRIALIGGGSSRRPQDVTVEAVRQGEEWEGFKVMEITKGSVVFQGRNGITTLQFAD